MRSKSSLSVSLTPELTAFIADEVRTGRYRTSSEVVRDGLRMLERDRRHEGAAEKHSSLRPNGSTPNRAGLDFLIGGGRAGEQIAAFDWGRTSLGPIDHWPQSLRTAVSIVLNSKFPTYMAWGPDLISFYNDAYRPILGSKPEALGRSFNEVWAESWSIVGPIAERAMQGEASFFADMPIPVERHGYPEETWWSFSYSPIRDETGGVGGVLCTVHETTSEVKARTSLQAEKERLRALFEQAPGFMCVLRGPEHVYELTNEAHRKLVGPRDIIGKPIREVLPELAGQGIFELLDTIHRSGETFVGHAMPVTLQRESDSEPEERLLDFVYQPILDESGRVTAIFVEGHDVTERVRSEQALRDSEARFRLFSEEAREGVVIHDGRVVLDCNPAYARMSGYDSIEAVIGRATADFATPDSMLLVREKNRVRHEEPYEIEARRKDGSTFPAEIVGREAIWHDEPVRIGVARDLTERKRREAALRESRAHLEMVLESTSDPFYALDREWRFTLFNAAAERFFGRTRQEVLGRTFWELFPDAKGSDFDRHYGEAMAGGSDITFQTVSKARPDRIVELRAAPMPSGGIAVALTDITERKKAEVALQESEARLEMATAAADLGVWDWDLVANTFTYSDRAKAIYGFPADEPVTLARLRAVNHPEDAERAASLARRALDPVIREQVPYEYRIIRPSDGKARWLLAHGEAVFAKVDGVERAVRYVGTIQDVTERKQAEESVRASEQRLSLAVEAGRMAVWEVDVPTGLVQGSPALNRVLGFPEDATPTPEEYRARYYPGEQERLRAIGQEAMARGERFFEAEYRYVWPDGDVRWLLMRAEIMLNHDGVPAKAVGVILDITGRKRAEEHQQLLINELNHRVKNTLATVQSMATQTLRDGAEQGRPRLRAFEDRLFALARAHDVLTRENWEGAELSEIVEGATGAFRQDGADRFEIGGPKVRLRPQMALAIAMGLHELATNATKAGALSTPAGRVLITWTVTDEEPLRLILVWKERGGPVVSPPTRRGFGTRLLERSLAADLGGEVRLSFEPAGVECVVTAPIYDERSAQLEFAA